MHERCMIVCAHTDVPEEIEHMHVCMRVRSVGLGLGLALLG